MRLNGRFGRFGGCYVPEILVPALEQLEAAFLDAQEDAAFATELSQLRVAHRYFQVFGGHNWAIWRGQARSAYLAAAARLAHA